MLEKFSRDYDSGKKLEYNKRLFATVAPVYDSVTRVLSFGRDRAWKKWFITMLPDKNYSTCLDVACGTGDVTLALKNRFANSYMYGFDLSEKMLECARVKDTSKSIAFVKGDMCHMPFDDGSCDLVTGAYALRNAPDVNDALKEFNRVLKSGGILGLLDFSRSSWRAYAAVQYALLTIWGSVIGLVYHRNPFVYSYIAESLQQFPDRRALHKQLEQSGFKVIRSKRFLLGIIEIIICEKM